jgi:hypothetical protein
LILPGSATPCKTAVARVHAVPQTSRSPRRIVENELVHHAAGASC